VRENGVGKKAPLIRIDEAAILTQAIPHDVSIKSDSAVHPNDYNAARTTLFHINGKIHLTALNQKEY
jgi:hypothetical protein